MNVPGPRGARRSGGFARSAGAAAGRGVLLIVFALAIGVLLLAKGLDGGKTVEVGQSSKTSASGAVTAPGGAKATTTLPTAATTTIPPKRSPADVRVLVINAREVNGAAAANKDVLIRLGYNGLVPATAPAKATSTTVYYSTDKAQGDAIGVADALQIPAAQVQSLNSADLGVDLLDADVIVVLGTDGLGVKVG